jgi:hypothetical protein
MKTVIGSIIPVKAARAFCLRIIMKASMENWTVWSQLNCYSDRSRGLTCVTSRESNEYLK